MLHYVHQLVANLSCLLFGAEQVVHSHFIRAFLWWKHLQVAAANEFGESGETKPKQ